MIFNGIEKDYLTVTRGRKRPAWAPINRELISVTGKSGAYLSHSTRQVRVIDVPVFLLAENFPELQKQKEDLAEWLVHDEPKELIFKDEPDRVYYAVIDGELDLDELVRWGEGVITFVCPDPYKYGPEISKTHPTDEITIRNNGTAEATPIIELTAKKKVTFAMIANEHEEYNLIGRPANVDEQVVNDKTTRLDEIGDTLSSWDMSGQGRFVKGSLGIQVGSYGSGVGDWHGPIAKKEITPIQDFEVDYVINITNEHQVERTYRIYIILHDENMNEIGMMRMWDRSQVDYTNVADIRIGSYAGDDTDIYLADYQNYNLRNQRVWNGILRMTRKGNRFDVYLARVTQNGTHVDTLKASYSDLAGKFTGKLKHITVSIAKHGALGANEIGINRVTVKELNKLTKDQTPYILDVGDVVIFDHKNDDILVNGEPRNDLKNFGGSFFTLKKGQNIVLVTPENSFDTKISYREKYL